MRKQATSMGVLLLAVSAPSLAHSQESDAGAPPAVHADASVPLGAGAPIAPTQKATPASRPLVPERATYMWSVDPVAVRETEVNSPGMMVGGTALVVAGGLGFFGGLGLLASGVGRGQGGEALGAGVLGGAALAAGVGIPLIVVGSEDVAVEAVPPHETEANSPGMMAGGTVLVVAGGLGLLGGVGLLVSSAGAARSPEPLGAGVLAVSALALGGGIPLIVVGSEEVPVDSPHAAAAPRLRLGAGSMDFSMGF